MRRSHRRATTCEDPEGKVQTEFLYLREPPRVRRALHPEARFIAHLSRQDTSLTSPTSIHLGQLSERFRVQYQFEIQCLLSNCIPSLRIENLRDKLRQTHTAHTYSNTTFLRQDGRKTQGRWLGDVSENQHTFARFYRYPFLFPSPHPNIDHDIAYFAFVNFYSGMSAQSLFLSPHPPFFCNSRLLDVQMYETRWSILSRFSIISL